jgi:hypothetical protein
MPVVLVISIHPPNNGRQLGTVWSSLSQRQEMPAVSCLREVNPTNQHQPRPWESMRMVPCEINTHNTAQNTCNAITQGMYVCMDMVTNGINQTITLSTTLSHRLYMYLPHRTLTCCSAFLEIRDLFHPNKPNPTPRRLHSPAQRLILPVRPLHAELVPLGPGRVVLAAELGVQRLQAAHLAGVAGPAEDDERSARGQSGVDALEAGGEVGEAGFERGGCGRRRRGRVGWFCGWGGGWVAVAVAVGGNGWYCWCSIGVRKLLHRRRSARA